MTTANDWLVVTSSSPSTTGKKIVRLCLRHHSIRRAATLICCQFLITIGSIGNEGYRTLLNPRSASKVHLRLQNRMYFKLFRLDIIT